MTACPVCRARVRARRDGTAGRHRSPESPVWFVPCSGIGLPAIDLPAQIGGARLGAGRHPVGAVALSERVTVLLSPSEVARIDEARGDWTRSEWLAVQSGLRTIRENL